MTSRICKEGRERYVNDINLVVRKKVCRIGVDSLATQVCSVDTFDPQK